MNTRSKLYCGLLCIAACLDWGSALAVAESQAAEQRAPHDMVKVLEGSYTALYKQNDVAQRIQVDSFYLDRFQVTNAEFAAFVGQNPQWSRQSIKPIFADATYLQHFEAQSMQQIAHQPVVNVSWFAGMAYCQAQGKRLPTLDEWEYTARASASQIDGSKNPQYLQQILDWYAAPASRELPDVADTSANYWGAHGMHGVVWELVRDINTSLVTGESRGDGSLDKQLFCGAGASMSVDPSDYAAFMRFALRSSYSSNYTITSLGFRCAKSL